VASLDGIFHAYPFCPIIICGGADSNIHRSKSVTSPFRAVRCLSQPGDIGEYTLRNEAAFVAGIGVVRALNQSNIWERNSNPGPDVDKDNFTSIPGLRYTF
jgi:hypothetical protein